MNALARSRVEAAIEALIALLDIVDSDCDLEADAPESDGDDEDYDEVIVA